MVSAPLSGGRQHKQTVRECWGWTAWRQQRRGQSGLNCILDNTWWAYAATEHIQPLAQNPTVLHRTLQGLRNHQSFYSSALFYCSALFLSLGESSACKYSPSCWRSWRHYAEIELCFVVDFLSNPLHKPVRQSKRDLPKNSSVACYSN